MALFHTTVVDNQIKALDTIGNAMRNLLKNEATSGTVGTITFTVNADKSITVNGSTTTQRLFRVHTDFSYNDNLIISGVPSGSGLMLNVVGLGSDTGSGFSFNGATPRNIQIVVPANTTVDNVTIYPMVRLASDTNSKYIPYNREICTFDTDRAENLINLEVAITATGGGGTPDSPIAINGFSACNLSVNGTTETIPFGQTIYGGSLNVGSGVLTVTHGYVDLGGLTWVVGSGGATRFVATTTTPTPKATGEIIADCLQTATNVQIYNGSVDKAIAIHTNNTIWARDTDYTVATDFQNAMLGHYAVYELATPTTIQLDSKQIQSIIGTNNIYADTGDIIDLKFVLSVGKAIS